MHGGLQARVHSLIQTTVVFAIVRFQQQYPRSSQSNPSKPLLRRDLTAHFFYKIEVVEIEYRSFQREYQPETVKIRQQSLSLDKKNSFLDQIQQETHHKTGLSLRKTTKARARTTCILQRA